MDSIHIKLHYPLKSPRIKLSFLIIFGFFFNISAIRCQTNNDIPIYNWFDKTVGKINLDINKGPLFINNFRTEKGNNIYLVDSKYTIGNLTYDNEIYYETKLNYDIHRDILILTSDESETIGIILNKEKVNSFSIYNKNFVYINNNPYNLADFKPGYYELSQYENNIILYIKHQKSIDYSAIKDGVNYFYFKENDSYYLHYKKVLYPISGKSDLIKVFPEHKKTINEFYSMNKRIKKSDSNQFMKNLVKSIVITDYNSTKK